MIIIRYLDPWGSASLTDAENEAVHNLHGKPGGCDTGAL